MVLIPHSQCVVLFKNTKMQQRTEKWNIPLCNPPACLVAHDRDPHLKEPEV